MFCGRLACMGLGVDEGHKRVIGDDGSDPSRPQEDRSISTRDGRGLERTSKRSQT